MDNIVFKISHYPKLDETFCRKSKGIFKYIGNSRIDGNPIFYIDRDRVRRGRKVKKLLGIETEDILTQTLYDLVKRYEPKILTEEIRYISTLDEHIKL